MRISDWSSDVCSSDLPDASDNDIRDSADDRIGADNSSVVEESAQIGDLHLQSSVLEDGSYLRDSPVVPPKVQVEAGLPKQPRTAFAPPEKSGIEQARPSKQIGRAHV